MILVLIGISWIILVRIKNGQINIFDYKYLNTQYTFICIFVVLLIGVILGYFLF